MAPLGFRSVAAADWLQFRGPSGGIAEPGELPTRLTTGDHVAWKSDLPGQGLSSPILVGDRVFVTSSSGLKQQRLHVVCLSAKDGSRLWERQFWATGRTMCHEKARVAAPTPVSDGQRIYALFSSNDLLCLDLDGNLLWTRGLGLDYPNASNSLGMSASLLVVDGVVVAQLENQSESFALGLEAQTGLNKWKVSRPAKENWTSPMTLRAGSRTLVALQAASGLTALDPATGQTVWELKESASWVPSCAVDGDLLFVPTKGLLALRLSPDGKAPTEVWRSSQLRPGTPSPVAFGDRVFALNDAGILTCGEKATGNRLWQLRLKGPFSSSPVAAGKFIYCVNEKGLLQVINTEAAEGEVVSELDLDGDCLSTPAIAGSAIFLRTDHRLWKIAKPRPAA
jgi:outer membrane protein assembly factor BamB